MKFLTKDEYDKKFEEGKHLAERLEEFYLESEKKKRNRALCTIAFYIVKNIFILYFLFDMYFGEVELEAIIPIVMISVVTALISYWMNFSIFSFNSVKSREENETIERMKKRLTEISEELDLKPKYEVENFFMNKHM